MTNTTYIPEDRIYLTHDFALAAVLSLVYPILSVDSTDPDEPWFTVERGEITDLYIERYRERQLLVEPQELIERIVDLRNRMKDSQVII